MKYRLTITVLMLVGTSVFLISAMKDDYGPYKPEPIQLTIPAGWPKPGNLFNKNKLTEQGFQLGKKLFYDERLSKNNELSCASCHQQFAAFSTYDHDLSHGVNNTFSTRNAPGLFNLAWTKEYHWDGGINHIEVQPLSPITASNEMGEQLDSVLYKIKKDTAYKRMFKAAFGDPAVTSQRMLKAIAQFTGTLVSAESKYDKVKNGIAKFNGLEERGYQVFRQHCESCHKEPLFTDGSYRNNGLDLNRFNDKGRQGITGQSADSLKFRVPSLRNIGLTFPYMHDGRIYSLSQVIDHYINTLNTSQPTLDPLLKNRLVISKKEKNELIYFLYTLTDTTFTKNNRFAAKIVSTGGHH